VGKCVNGKGGKGEDAKVGKRESGKLAEREEGFAPVQSPSLLTHLTIQLFNQAEGRIAAVAAEVTRLKPKGLKARKKTAQGKASRRATPKVA